MASLKKTDTAESTIKMMQGSSTGPSYFPFARKGNVLLGIKPQGAAAGERWGLSECTYFAARLRSAPENGLFAEEDAGKKVVKLVKNPDNVWDAWPNVVWEKKSVERASTTIGVFVEGKFNEDKVQLNKLLAEIKDGKLTLKMAKYLVEVAGKENMLCGVNDLAAWLESQFKPFFDKILEHLAVASAVTDEMKQHVGHFNMEAALLKKVYEFDPSRQEGQGGRARPRRAGSWRLRRGRRRSRVSVYGDWPGAATCTWSVFARRSFGMSDRLCI